MATASELFRQSVDELPTPLAALRRVHGLTVRQVATACELGYGRLAALERSPGQQPRRALAQRLADFYEVDREALFAPKEDVTITVTPPRVMLRRRRATPKGEG